MNTPPLNFGAFRAFESVEGHLPRVKIMYDTTAEAAAAIALSQDLKTANVNHTTPEENRIDGYSYYKAFPKAGYSLTEVRDELGKRLNIIEG